MRCMQLHFLGTTRDGGSPENAGAIFKGTLIARSKKLPRHPQDKYIPV